MKEEKIRKASGIFAIVVGVMLLSVTVYGITTYEISKPTLPGFDGGNDGDADGDGHLEDWYTTQIVRSKDIHLGVYGEAAVGSGTTGWLSAFHLDYAQVPETVLANNATDWSTSGNADGYVDADNQQTDLASENGAYICIRVKHNNVTLDGGVFNHSRVRCLLNVTVDETIDNVTEYNNSATNGDAVISDEHANHLFVNYWWDDGVDGYRITDDGELVWYIIIQERY